MKNLIFTALCILFSTILFSQELQRKKVTDGSGNDIPSIPPPQGYPACDSCFTFGLSFSVTAPISSNILDDISLITTSLTGTVSGFDNSSWGIDTIVDTNCNTYTYTQNLSICFEMDSTLCSAGQETRTEDVTFYYEVDETCLADYLSIDPVNDYFDQNCVGPNADSCDPSTFTFVNICCDEAEPSQKRNNIATLNIGAKISPNPCLDNLYIEGLTGGELIVISSVIGEKLKTITVEENKTDIRIDNLNDIPSGVNFLHIIRSGKIVTHCKFVKQ